jgi:hypothetical protein
VTLAVFLQFLLADVPALAGLSVVFVMVFQAIFDAVIGFETRAEGAPAK